MRYVLPVLLDANALQSRMSLARVVALAQQHGWEEAAGFVHTTARDSLLLSVMGPLDLMEAMTRPMPTIFSLPVKKEWGVMHFYGDGMLQATSQATTTGLFQLFCLPSSPTTPRSSLISIRGWTQMNEDNIWRFISVVIRGVNTMIRFACDLQNFIDEETGNIDFMRQNKFFGTLGMIIADLQQTALTLHAYTRVRFSFGLMDKLANLKSEFTGIKDEPLLGRGMASISQASWLRQQIRQFIREDNGNIQSLLVRVVSNCYGPLHRHLRQELSIFGPSEADRLKALWTFRDLHHGAYLRGQKYDTLFHSGGVTVAPEVPALPFLLMLGLMLNPNEFLKFIPSIRKH